jgi:hypothetical protein
MHRVEHLTGCYPTSFRSLFENKSSTLSSHSFTLRYRLSINFINGAIIGTRSVCVRVFTLTLYFSTSSWEKRRVEKNKSRG